MKMTFPCSFQKIRIICAVNDDTLTFEDLGLNDAILDGLYAMGFEKPTPIQEQAIVEIINNKDVIASAQTGTGKTGAFILPSMHKIMETNPTKPRIRALVIVPTRELAVQIDQQIEGFSYYTSVSSIAIYGGSDAQAFDREKKALTSGVEFVIATPGRFISHLNLGYVDLSELDILILDEADRMLDMGFYGDILRIVKHIGKDRQTLLFSATMPDRMVKLSKEILNDPIRINIALSKPAEGVIQGAYVVYEEQKSELVKELLAGKDLTSVIVFASTKKSVRKVYDTLKRSGMSVGSISSDLEQKDREEVMLSFKNRKMKVLVATDVVSRGIDIDGIDLVINYDVPSDAEDYVHRIGRTARAESTGVALTLIGTDEQGKFGRIEQLIGSEVRKLVVPEALGKVPAYEPTRKKSFGNKRKNFKSGGQRKNFKK